MNIKLSRLGWTLTLGALLIALLATFAICEDPAPTPPAAPSYLDTATYKGVNTCKMCHSNPKIVPENDAVYSFWSTTKHASFNQKLPWEKDGVANPELPAVEEVYRHVTGYDPATKTWKDKGITCEACHGPGSAHMMAPKDQKKATILDPANLKTPGQQISVCGRCHGQYTIDKDQHVALKFKTGQDLLTTDGFKLDAVQPSKPMQQMNELVTSKHFRKGMTCFTCHTAHSATQQPHALQKPIIELCTSCHANKTMAGHAPKAAADATCATCHMPNGMHTFVKPHDD